MPLDDEGRKDEDLLADFVGGDQSAFADLMRRHEDRIFAVALRITGNRADALDATQDAFISAFRRAGSFRGESAFSTWLYRIGINSCNDLLRKKGRSPIPQDDQVAEERASATLPGVSLEDEVTTKLDVSAALAQLSVEYREAVAMHDLGGIPYEEIAEAMGVAVGTVKSRISRGRRKLALLLEHPRGNVASKERDEPSL